MSGGVRREGRLTDWAVGHAGEAGEREAVADLALHLAVLHGEVEAARLVGVLAGVGADDAGPLGLAGELSVREKVKWVWVTHGLLEEDIF